MVPRERLTLDTAIKKFENETGLKVRIHTFNKQMDFILQLEEQELVFDAEVRLFINKSRIGTLLTRFREKRGIPLLITEYINPELMKMIEENGVNVIDTAGNIYIKVPPLVIKIKGNKPARVKGAKTKIRSFYPSALRTIFALLCNPGIEKKAIREIAEFAGVAHGSAHRTLLELERQGYLKGRGTKEIALQNKEELLERWTTSFPENLKPKFFLDRYNLKDEIPANIKLIDYDALWGGEEAAARLTNYLRPFIYTIYIGERKGEFVLRNRLRRDPDGNLILMKKFWNFENYDYPGITHPILVYADLLATGDPRNIETAKIIYEKNIVRYIKKD